MKKGPEKREKRDKKILYCRYLESKLLTNIRNWSVFVKRDENIIWNYILIRKISRGEISAR